VEKPPLLLLTHRIPFPPNKGDKIRSYHLLRALAKRYRVFLGTYIDDPADNAYRDTVSEWCEDTCFIEIDPLKRKVAALRGLACGTALTLPYYASARLRAWVGATIESEQIDLSIAFSSATAQFLLGSQFTKMRRVMDFIDIDSDKWAQYAAHQRFPMNWLYRREARCLLKFEREVAREFDASVFVSEHEAALFKRLAPESKDKVHAIYNGVDLERFSPDVSLDNPYTALSTERHLVFVGAMDYWPNVDAVQWFVKEVLPLVANTYALHLWIVGSNPTREVQALEKHVGVTVTGRVDDVRNYLAHADICVAPLRIARGIQNKVLESLAMRKATLVTPQALEGIPAEDGRDLLVADGAKALARGLETLLNDASLRDQLGRRGRALVESHFSWEGNLTGFDALLN
jgi:sugar transferase (PEP-CTERM/EpsH1 system associated)